MWFSHRVLTDRNLEQSIVVLSASVDNRYHYSSGKIRSKDGKPSGANAFLN
jgi:hypothetical protein